MITPMTGDTVEQFCREYVRNGGNAGAAYNHAKPGKRTIETARVQGCLMLKKPAVAARLAELAEAARIKYEEVTAAERAKAEQERLAAQAETTAEAEERGADLAAGHLTFGSTVADIARQLDEDRTFAYAEGAPAAAISASVAKGKLFGHFIEKKDITIGMRPDEARQVIAALLARFGKPPA